MKTEESGKYWVDRAQLHKWALEQALIMHQVKCDTTLDENRLFETAKRFVKWVDEGK